MRYMIRMILRGSSKTMNTSVRVARDYFWANAEYDEGLDVFLVDDKTLDAAREGYPTCEWLVLGEVE